MDGCAEAAAALECLLQEEQQYDLLFALAKEIEGIAKIRPLSVNQLHDDLYHMTESPDSPVALALTTACGSVISALGSDVAEGIWEVEFHNSLHPSCS